MKITPRVYQIAAVKAAVKALRSRAKRALVVLATGLGKTFTGAFIVKELSPKRTLFLVHNNFILQHAVEQFGLVLDKRTKMATYNGIFKDGAEDADIVFATWQTMGKNLKQWPRDYFDLVIVDEAHHAEAKTYKPVLNYFTGAKLGLTATPDRVDKHNIRTAFGSEAINVSLEEAIARGWLPRIEYHVITDQSLNEATLQKVAAEIREGKRRFTMAEVNRRIFIRKRDVEITKIINGYTEKALVFCASISHAERLAKTLDSASTFHSAKGTTKDDTWTKNQASLEGLRNGTLRRVCSVNAFNEGINVPSVGLVAFCRATNALTVFRQQLGRGLRPGKDKLIVLDFVGNLERIQLVLETMNRVANLHEKFTSKRELEREGYVRQGFEVSGTGFEFTFSDQVVDLIEVLNHCEKEIYSTWQEASDSAKSLGILSSEQYKHRYREDSGLMACPHVFYPDWPGWRKFLGTEPCFYATWQEASDSAKRLGISSGPEYGTRYREDANRLPANPPKFYPDWPGWRKFLGTEPCFYATWQEASASAIKLGITSKRSYLRSRQEDCLLPYSPNILYEDFPGWKKFLGTDERIYKTWQLANESVVKLGITSQKDYARRYHEDRRLPSSPSYQYQDFPGWTEFLGKVQKHLYPTWQEAADAARHLGISSATEYMIRYKEDPRLPSTPCSKYRELPNMAIFFGKSPRKSRNSANQQ